MKTNVKVSYPPLLTHEGAPAVRVGAEAQLRRSVMSCLLFEREFYEDGTEITERIATLVPQVAPATVAALAIEAREQMKLRHVPLFLVREMARHVSHRPHVEDTLYRVIQRADEMAEFLALYWSEGKTPIANSVRRGLARAFEKFDSYQFSKWQGKDRAIKLRDVMFLVHPHPDTPERAALYKKIADRALESPDTWEVALSAQDELSKREKWERLLRENRLGDLAVLRNLRNFEQEGVSSELIRQGIASVRGTRVLPFRYIAAARHAPRYEGDLEVKFFESLADTKLPGKTVILVDVSGSMKVPLSAKSDMTRLDAGCGLAMVAREICSDVVVYTFSNKLVMVPSRRGFALRDAVVGSQFHGGTHLGAALADLYKLEGADRLIVITDEQAHDRVPAPSYGRAYMINVASARNGIGYGKWMHIDGMSESIFRYILAVEEVDAPVSETEEIDD